MKEQLEKLLGRIRNARGYCLQCHDTVKFEIDECEKPSGSLRCYDTIIAELEKIIRPQGLNNEVYNEY